MRNAADSMLGPLCPSLSLPSRPSQSSRRTIAILNPPPNITIQRRLCIAASRNPPTSVSECSSPPAFATRFSSACPLAWPRNHTKAAATLTNCEGTSDGQSRLFVQRGKLTPWLPVEDSSTAHFTPANDLRWGLPVLGSDATVGARPPCCRFPDGLQARQLALRAGLKGSDYS